MKPFVPKAEPVCTVLQSWKRDLDKDCSIQDGNLCSHPAHFLREGGKEISCPYSERKQKAAWWMWWLCGTATAQQKLVDSEELCVLQNRAERVKVVAARGVFKIQSQILIMRIANKVSELLWMATLPQQVPVLPQHAPVSLPAMRVRGTKSKAWIVVGEK